MTPEQLAYLCCPSCRTAGLHARGAPPGELLCRACGKTVPVVGGIPRFVPDEDYADTFGFQWNIHRQTQLDSHSGLPISRDRLFEVTHWPRDMSGEVIAEAGSGAGRFTEILVTTGAQVLSFDLSTAVDANYKNNGHHPNLLLFQADIRNAPIREGSMDRVMCFGVVQSTPNPEETFRRLARYVRPGGELVIDCYSARLRSLISWKYLLRPLTKRMDKNRLHNVVRRVTPPLVPVAAFMRRVFGRAGARLLPIIQYQHLGLSPAQNREWAILDTFDMYSPAHDHPQTRGAIRRWYREAGFVDVVVQYGPNGIVARGRRSITA
jgi:SAM-dependent methyltransferase